MKHQLLNTTQETKNVKMERTIQELLGFKFANANNQNIDNLIIRVLENLPNFEEGIKNE